MKFEFTLTTLKGNRVNLEMEEGLVSRKILRLELVDMGVTAKSAKRVMSAEGKYIKIPGTHPEPNFRYECFECLLPGHDKAAHLVLDKESSLDIRNTLAAARERIREESVKEYRVREAKRIAEIEKNIPGYSELQDAYREHVYYREAFARAMEDEYNDGARMPKAPTSDIEDLEARYPRAALYFKAESYSLAANDRKASAGDRAMMILKTGGSEAEAAEVLDNWLPEESIWD